MRIINQREAKELLGMPEALDIVERAYEAYSRGRAKVPLRCNMELDQPEKYAMFMPGFVPDLGALGVKVVSVFPENGTRGLPNTLGVILLLNPVTGMPAGLIDGTYITELRTGAGTGVATRYLARADASVLALIGTGGMAAKQLEAVCAVRPVTDVLVYNRTRTKAESFIDQVQEELGLPLVYHLVDSAEMAVRAADIVVASTTSVEPVVRFDWLKPGAHVNAVGAFHKGMQEIDEDTVVNARYRVVDGIDAAAVSGDIANPLERGRIGRDALLEIGALVANKDAITRSNRDITLYKSVGLSVLDMAVANEVLVKAECLGVGDVCNSL